MYCLASNIGRNASRWRIDGALNKHHREPTNFKKTVSYNHKSRQYSSDSSKEDRFKQLGFQKQSTKSEEPQKEWTPGPEWKKLHGSEQETIDEKGNVIGPGGIAMPTQSSGGLTKRNNSDFTRFDIFEGEGIAVTAYGKHGFVINEDYNEGSLIIFPKNYWTWKAQKVEDITVEMLAPIWLHNPSPQILVLGTGETLIRPNPELIKFLLVRGITTEICSTVRKIRFHITKE